MKKIENKTITIIGAGNLGLAIINGLVASGFLTRNRLIATKRKIESIASLGELGVQVEASNLDAIESADIVILCVQPGQLPDLALELDGFLDGKLLISTITGANLEKLHHLLAILNQCQGLLWLIALRKK